MEHSSTYCSIRQSSFFSRSTVTPGFHQFHFLEFLVLGYLRYFGSFEESISTFHFCFLRGFGDMIPWKSILRFIGSSQRELVTMVGNEFVSFCILEKCLHLLSKIHRGLSPKAHCRRVPRLTRVMGIVFRRLRCLDACPWLSTAEDPVNQHNKQSFLTSMRASSLRTVQALPPVTKINATPLDTPSPLPSTSSLQSTSV